MVTYERNLNALLIIILSGVLLSAYAVQFLWNEEPCPLCLLQRLGMLGVASGALMNLRFGVRPFHYGLSLISAVVGGTVALRQISLHVCPGFAPPFGLPVLGLSLYTWSFLVFVCSVLYIAFLLFLYKPGESELEPAAYTKWSKTAFSLIFFVALTNVITTWMQCGLGPCVD